MEAEIIPFAKEVLSDFLHREPHDLSIVVQGGGCINQVVRINTSEGPFFLKWNHREALDQFQKEASGLDLLRETGTIDIPEVLSVGTCRNRAFILLEFIESHRTSNQFWQNFGQQLAELHHSLAANAQYGLAYDNYIGRLPQNNSFTSNWVDFFISQRLEVQVKLALGQGLFTPQFLDRFRRLYDLLPAMLPNEPPSLLHGDLWSGNFISGTDDKVILIDPAVYYGHREAELSFTHLFGGFDSRFYQSYFDSWPVEPGFEERIDIYNLYPLLVHLNLFGSSYFSQIELVIRRYT